MRIKQKHTINEMGASYEYWKEHILKLHLEENYEILSKPDLVDVYQIDITNGNKNFVDTTDRNYAIQQYLNQSNQYTIVDTDLSQFDEFYRKIDKTESSSEELKSALENVKVNDFTSLTKDTPKQEESIIKQLITLGFLDKINSTDYKLSENGLEFLKGGKETKNDSSKITITHNNFHNSQVGQINQSDKIDVGKQSSDSAKKGDSVMKQVIVGLIITVLGGIILYYLFSK